MHLRHIAFTALLVLVLTAAACLPAAAQDTVFISSTSTAQGRLRLQGKILDYTGTGLRIELAGGVVRKYAPEQVVRVETTYTRPQLDADALYAKAEFNAALALYRQARTDEPRAWVRRQITAQMVWCYQALNAWGPAGEEFLVLVRSDPATIFFGCIPLAWAPAEPSAALEQAARQWFARDEMPVSVLLGASHLLPTDAHAAALARLKELSTAEDARVAQLALAQTWRAETVTANSGQLNHWARVVEAMPEPLRAGPYYVLGLAWAQRQQWQPAALAWLRIPIEYPQHRLLAARSLLGAGEALERLSRPRQAAALYGELLAQYADSPLAAEARARLNELQKTPP